MQTRNIDELISEVHVLYNQDKLPLNQKTEEEISRMIKDHFLYMRKFIQQPYNLEYNMEKVARFKIRYRQIRSKINNLVKDLKFIRDVHRRLCMLEEWYQRNGGSPYGQALFMLKDSGKDFDKELDSKVNKFTKAFNRFNIDKELTLWEIEGELKAELKYWWILKQKFMHQYTKTGKYKRLQKLRKMWQERNEEEGKVDIRMKEDYKPYQKTQMPIDQTTWLIDPS